MVKNELVAPVLKWVGGKRQLLEEIKPLLPEKPKTISSYCEPFVGGGALLFELQPKKAQINDINEELINVYQVIKEDVNTLIDELSRFENNAELFYQVRDWDRNKQFYDNLTSVEKAARTLFLNKTCYNGLYRVNNAGEFNTPFGNYKNPNFINAPVLKAVSSYFNSADITMTSEDYSVVLDSVKKGTFVYLDPPYDPVSDTSSFTGYAKGGFGRSDQIALYECCKSLDARGIKFMMSNSATEFIKDLYHGFDITVVQAKRSINSVGNKRGDVDEVIIRNYGSKK